MFRELCEALGNGVGTSAGGASGRAAQEKGSVPGTGAEPAGGGVTTGRNRKTFRLSPVLYGPKGLAKCAPGSSSQTYSHSDIIKSAPHSGAYVDCPTSFTTALYLCRRFI